MHRFRALRAVPLVLFFVLVVFGCATGRDHAADAGFGMTATAVPEGILLTFSNIPDDAVRLFVNVSSWSDAEEAADRHDIISAYADIVDESFFSARPSFQLERLRETGRVVFPIVQAGQRYRISAMVATRQDHELMMDDVSGQIWVEAEGVAEGGIYFNRADVALALNDTNSAVTITSEPIFTSDVTFHAQKYSFGVTILVGEHSSIGVGDHHIPQGLSADGLTWTFEPQMTENLIKDASEWLESGVLYTAWVTAYVDIIYDDITWSVEIAKTPRFAFSLE